MLDEAQQEAKRLAASLRQLDADAFDNARAVVLALQTPISLDLLKGAAATLVELERQIPNGTLGAMIRVRLSRLQGLVNAMLDDNNQPPPAA